MFDFEAFAKDYNIGVTTRSKDVSRGWVGVRCPFCIPRDTGHHLGYHLNTGHFTCWKCGYHSVYNTVSAFLGYLPDNISDLISKYQKIGTRGHNRSEIVTATKVELPNKPMNKVAKSYLEERDFDSRSLIKTYDMRGGGITGFWKYRIVIPVYQQGQIVTAIGRTIVKGVEPRYKALSDKDSIIPVKSTLFGLDMLNGSRSVILVEGPFDQMRIGNKAVALHGTGVDPFQKEMISRLFDRVLILFDAGDNAAKAAERLATDLCALGVPSVEIVTGFTSKDPGEFTTEEVNEVRRMI